MELITLSDAAREADRSISTVHRWIKEGRLVEGADFYKVGTTSMVVFNAARFRDRLPDLTSLLETRGAGGRPRKPRT